MKLTLCLLACLLTVSVAVWAQDTAAYQGWMKSNGAAVASLRKNLDAKAGDAAAADAKTLVDNFGHVSDYWQQKNVADAVKFATDAQNGFKNVAQLAAAGKFDDASAALQAAQANCAGCHMAHRQRGSDGSFSIK